MKDEAYNKNYHFEDTYWWFVVRNRIVLDMIREYTPAKDLDILDFGCGTGKMLELMGGMGNVQGCDMSEQALDYCRRRGLDNLILQTETLDNLKTYDLITLLDVIEHIEDDAGLLADLKSHLVPGGKMVISVPALPCLWSGEDYVSDHRRRYVRKQLESIVTGAGMNILRMSYFNSLLVIPIFLKIRMSALLNPESMKHSNLQEIPGWLNSMLKAVFSLEIPLLRGMNLPPGMSIICVAENPGA